MRIVVNDVAAVPNGGGVYSILQDLYNDVIDHDKKNEWIFILAGKFFKETSNVKIIVRKDLKNNKLKKLWFELVVGRHFINALHPDVYISLQNIATLGVKTQKQIVYLHQPIPFEYKKRFSFFKKEERSLAIYQKLIGEVIKKTLRLRKPKIIVQTNWMKDAVSNQCNIKPEQIIVAHPKISNSFSKIYNGKGNLFIYPASSFIYKNHKVIFDAIRILKRKDTNNFKIVLTLNKSQLPYNSENIEYLGHIPRNEVMQLYTKSILIFPSYIESFGLPLVEAASEADIIFAADTVFSRELLGNYSNVYYFNYNNANELASLLKKAINREIVTTGERLRVDVGESVLETILKCINQR